MILVTGATGHLGKQVAKLLAEQGLPLRLLVRDKAKAPQNLRAEIYIANYGDTLSMERAFTGIDTAFLVSVSAPPGQRAKLHAEAFAIAERMGVNHVVYLSLQGASEESEYPFSQDHWESEQRLRASGLPHTILRNGKYTEQLLESDMVDRDGILRGPPNGKKIAWISRADSARVIAAILPNPPGGIVTYTGPEALTLEDTALRISKALGRRIPFQKATPEEARGRMLAQSAAGKQPTWRADLSAGTYRAIVAGEYGQVHDASGFIGKVETLEDTVRSGALDDLRSRGSHKDSPADEWMRLGTRRA